jgi:hypothetical protein
MTMSHPAQAAPGPFGSGGASAWIASPNQVSPSVVVVRGVVVGVVCTVVLVVVVGAVVGGDVTVVVVVGGTVVVVVDVVVDVDVDVVVGFVVGVVVVVVMPAGGVVSSRCTITWCSRSMCSAHT